VCHTRREFFAFHLLDLDNTITVICKKIFIIDSSTLINLKLCLTLVSTQTCDIILLAMIMFNRFMCYDKKCFLRFALQLVINFFLFNLLKKKIYKI